MASGDASVDAEVRSVLEKNRARRERLKLEILASLRTPPKEEERPISTRARRMTSGAVLDEPVRRSESKADAALLTLPARVLLERNFYRSLADEKERRANKAKATEEIAKLKVVHAQSRQDMKQQAETIKIARAKNRRMRRVLQALQTRLVASALVLQYQMDRKVELTHKLENIIYYRDAVIDNAFAYLYGAFRIDSTVPLGGVFSPYAYLDMDEEADKNDREVERLLTLTPQIFKSGAQQRRVSLRNALNEGLAAFIHPALLSNSHAASVDYSTLAKLTPMSTLTSAAPISPRSVSSTSDLTSLMSSSPASLGDPKKGSSDDSSTGDGSHASTKRRLTVGKGLKPSQSAGPRIAESTNTKKQPGGFLGLFSSNKPK